MQSDGKSMENISRVFAMYFAENLIIYFIKMSTAHLCWGHPKENIKVPRFQMKILYYCIVYQQ